MAAVSSSASRVWTISGGPGEPEKVLAGHLSDGVIKGMVVEIYELLDA